MSLFSIADLHLSQTVNKPMDKFGSRWTDHTEKLIKRWKAVVTAKDTVIIPGDISWAISLEEALEDFRLIESLPGKKLIGKGNHDYWWGTLTKMYEFFEKNNINTIKFLYNNAYEVEDYIVCGTRGWYVEEKLQNETNADYTKIVNRENQRLELCLKEAIKLKGDSDKQILVYLHFPPIFKNFICNELIDTMKKYNVKNCYFGHIHGLYSIGKSIEYDGILFTMISSDFLDFVPMITMPLDY